MLEQLGGPEPVLSLAAALFALGLFGLFLRKNMLVWLMCLELLLNAVNLTFVVFAKQLQDLGGEVAVFFTIPVAAAESAVGLGLLIALFRTLRTVQMDAMEQLRD